jgi:four helix bundle protein
MLELSHKKLDVWKLSVEFVAYIYSLTEEFPKTEIYGITNQLRRAAVSVAANIAEGAARRTGPDKRRFFEISRSSLVEIDSHLEVSMRLKFCNEENLRIASGKLNHLFAMLTNLIKSTK